MQGRREQTSPHVSVMWANMTRGRPGCQEGWSCGTFHCHIRLIWGLNEMICYVLYYVLKNWRIWCSSHRVSFLWKPWVTRAVDQWHIISVIEGGSLLSFLSTKSSIKAGTDKKIGHRKTFQAIFMLLAWLLTWTNQSLCAYGATSYYFSVSRLCASVSEMIDNFLYEVLEPRSYL